MTLDDLIAQLPGLGPWKLVGLPGKPALLRTAAGDCPLTAFAVSRGVHRDDCGGTPHLARLLGLPEADAVAATDAADDLARAFEPTMPACESRRVADLRARMLTAAGLAESARVAPAARASDPDARAVGRRVRAAREAAGLSISELAARARVSRTTVGKAERGKRLGAEAASRVAAALGLAVGDLTAGAAAAVPADSVEGFETGIGRLVRDERLRRGLAVHDVADRAGVSAMTVYAWERGRGGVTVRNLFLVAGALGVRVADLLPPISVEAKAEAVAGD